MPNSFATVLYSMPSFKYKSTAFFLNFASYVFRIFPIENPLIVDRLIAFLFSVYYKGIISFSIQQEVYDVRLYNKN